jgi:hypothetical protein
VVFSVIYVLLFIIAFSSFANFGLLARERVQLYPLFLVLLAIPAPAIDRVERLRTDDAALLVHSP